MTGGSFAGKVAAVIGHGDDTHRAIAVALAESGADVALATTARTQAEEYGANSIANEIWAIGREHFVQEMDAANVEETQAFAEQVWATLGRCDLLVIAHAGRPSLAVNAFAPLMERQGGGQIALIPPKPSETEAAIWQAKGVRIDGIDGASPSELAAAVLALNP